MTVLKYLGIAVVIVAIGLALLITRWRVNDYYPSPDLPWNGPDSKPIEQYRDALINLGPTPSKYHRWFTSRSHKPEPNYYGRIIDKYILELDEYQEWRTSGSVWYGGDDITTREAPYKIKFVSIEPIVAVLTAPDPEGMNLTERGRFVSSRYLSNHYYYGTQFPDQENVRWFIPSVPDEPRPLVVPDTGQLVVEIPGGRLQFTRSDESIEVIRLP